MTLKGEVIFKEKFNSGLKSDIRILDFFIRAVASLKIWLAL